MDADGFAQDEQGNPTRGGMRLSLGEFIPGKECSYEELLSKLPSAETIVRAMPGKLIENLGMTDIRYITPDEYWAEYGDEDEDGDWHEDEDGGCDDE